MRRILLAAAVALLGATSAGALERGDPVHATPPLQPHPYPQGVPYVTIGGPSHAPIVLRYGVVNGKRVLFDARTGRGVYRLVP